MSKRIRHIDIAAGVMILWMIIYHAICYAWSFDLRDYWWMDDLSLLPAGLHAIINNEGRIETLNPCVLFPYLSFFMPWFFYKSGQFFKKKSINELWIKDSSKLLCTFVVWSAIGYIFYLVFNFLQHTLTFRSATFSIVRGLFLTGKIPINEPLWFLLTLFGVRAIANITLPNKEDKWSWLKALGLAAIGYMIAYLAYRVNYRLLPYWIANGASGYAFFVLGYGLREYESKWWIIMPSLCIYLLCCVVGFPMVDMMFNKLIAGNYLLWMPVALCGIVTFNTVCRFISKYISIKPLELVGQYAMPIYVMHILVVLTIQFVIYYFKIEILYSYMLWLFLAGYVLFLPLSCRYIPIRCHNYEQKGGRL